MSLGRDLLRGAARAARAWRLVALAWLANALAAGLVALPAFRLLDSFFGHSAAGAAFAEGFDLGLAAELAVANPAALAMLSALTGAALAAHAVARLFWWGGAWSELAAPASGGTAAFWAGGARCFGRYLRLFGWSLWVLALFLLPAAAVAVATRVALGAGPRPDHALPWRLATVGLTLLGLFAWSVVVDLARLEVAHNDERRTRRALRRALGVFFRRRGSAAWLAAAPALAGAGVLLAQRGARPAFAGLSVGALAGLAVVTQLAVVARLWLATARAAALVEWSRRGGGESR